LAEEYRQVGRKEEAIAQLDTLGDICLDVGDQKAAIQAIETIIAMNPSNLEQYLAALAKLKSEL
jgi:hypothetical protein